MEQAGVRRDRAAIRSRAGAPGTSRRGDHRAQGLVQRAAGQLRRRALHDHRLRRAAGAGALPPFFIGGGGKRTLTLAGREADIVGLAPRILHGRLDAGSITLAATREKIEWARAAAGDRADALDYNIYPSGWPATVTDDLHGEVRKVIDALRKRTGTELSEADVLDSPHLFIGSVDRLVEKFLQLREELGIRSILLGEIGELEPVLARLSDQ